jgi:hypothetical protein
MTIRRLRNTTSNNHTNSTNDAKAKSAKRSMLRSRLLEVLEARHLMAAGPQLIGVQPNNSDLIENGVIRNIAPRELTFRFDDSQVIDVATVSGIRVTRAGSDGSFGLPSLSTDLGTTGKVDLQLTSKSAADQITINVTRRDNGPTADPVFSFSGVVLNIELNSNPAAQITAARLVDLLNAPKVANGPSVPSDRLVAKINGGIASTKIGGTDPAAYSPLRIVSGNDIAVLPGAVVIGDSPNENEVTLRFAENLPDDNYRLEVFGFDDAGRGIRGLKNVNGDFFVPTKTNTRQDTIDFRLDLGARVTAVVPQPIVRQADSSLQQLRNTIVVYFDNDKLVVENDALGRPTARSVESPSFYQLLYTSDTIRNTDDLPAFNPRTVTYNASANTATLVFDSDVDLLPGSFLPSSTFRLRVGTRETAPLAPNRSEASATAISDLNTNGAAKVRFTSKTIGESGSGTTVSFTNSGTTAIPTITVVGNAIRVNLGPATTVNQVIAALETDPLSSPLIKTTLEPGSNGALVVGTRPINYSPVTLFGLGSSFDTASNLGTIGSVNVPSTSLILSSSIDPELHGLDSLGASNDPAQRLVAEKMENHVNPDFGGDNFTGIRTIYYNFKDVYAPSFSNAILPKQKDRIREAFTLWSNKIGVTFRETADTGLTIALGDLNALGTGSDVQRRAQWGVRIDPNYETSLAVFSAGNTWSDNYGENLTRSAAASIGYLLGLSNAGNLDPSELLNLDSGFIDFPSGADRNFEPVFPGNQDVIHGQYLHRTEGSDIDLYRFDVDFGANGSSRTGVFVAETIAERLVDSSTLDSRLALYRQRQATATSNLGAGQGVQVEFTAVKSGKLGNNLQVFVTRSNRGVGALPIVSSFPNAVTIDLNSTIGSESTLAEMLTAIDANSGARSLVKVKLSSGAASTVIGNRDITYSPITLNGGDMELVSQNDNYFSDDSLIRTTLSSGVYFIGVSASGNDNYDAAVPGTGTGGRSQGKYDLRLTFRAQTDSNDTIQDVATGGDTSLALDGDADGTPGGVYNFWFQTRPLDRALRFNAGGSSDLEGKIITIRSSTGVDVRFEFSLDANVGIGNTRIPFALSSSASDLATNLANAIANRTELGVTATTTGSRITLRGERLVQLSPGLTIVDLSGKTIFVDKSAGPNADGSLAKPFNNISGAGVANAFGASVPGDIVRIVGNGGQDNRLETSGDNLAYEIGFGLLPGSILSDGATMDVPKGVTVMIDAGAVFKLNRSRIGVGSSTLGEDRSGSALQVLGAPILLDRSGNALKLNNGTVAPGSVFFTSWLDESIGFDNYQPTTTPTPGNWGGLVFKRDLDAQASRFDLEDEGIFRQYVNHADIRYGGSSAVVIDSVQQTVNAIQIVDMRPTISYNRISFSADAAMSATPASFRETLFSEPEFQRKGSFTPDYDRVGPEIHDNVLIKNSINGLFIKVPTLAGGEIKQLTVPGRFDDVDIVHVISENIIIQGNPGAAVIDQTSIPANLISTRGRTGGQLAEGIYNFKITFVDKNGFETPASDSTQSITLTPGLNAISLVGLPAASGEYVSRRLYRSSVSGTGPYRLAAELDGGNSSYEDLGKELTDPLDDKASLFRDRPDVRGVTAQNFTGTTLAVGSYTYRIVMVDIAGRESLASAPTNVITNSIANQSILLSNLPQLQPGYATRRIYRSSATGSGPFTLIANLLDSRDTSYADSGATIGGTLSVASLGTARPRLDASLSIDPGTIVKLEGARLEIGQSAHLYAEGVDGGRVVFTSKQDDRFGAGGTFDTNNNGQNAAKDATPGDWSGIYAATGSTLLLDHAVVGFAGGSSRIEGTFKSFSPVELQQANSRIAHTTFENNANGIGGQGPIDRLGRPANENYPLGNNASRGSTLFIRGVQPIVLGNTFQNNVGSAITIDANSMDAQIRGDSGRQNGLVDRSKDFDANRGPLFRENRLFNNSINGLEIRGDASTNNRDETALAVRDLQRNILTTESVWDDTDLVHVLFDSITVSNLEHSGGLRLQSAINESLVVKFEGQGSNFDKERGTGLTATGRLSSVGDRVGGTVQILGQPGFPVVLTSLRDDTVGAGTQPNGLPQTDTNNDGIATIPRAGDWRSLLFDSFSNDRNVTTVLEIEPPNTVAPGSNDSTIAAQFLGKLAPNESTTDENLPLGYVIHGVLSEPNDQDVYSFVGTAGTEVWFDIDSTRYALDTVLEVLNTNGNLLARSDNSTDEQAGTSLILTTPSINPNFANPLTKRVTPATHRNASGSVKDDYSSNPKDAGLRLVLPGIAGSPSTYFFRVRSKSTNVDNAGAGLTSGSYDVQIRIREQQEFPGSTVQFADVRFATNGVYASGLPFHSPLTAEASVGMLDNTPTDGGTFVGNVHMSDRGAISVAGSITQGQTNVIIFDVGDVNLISADPSTTYPISIDFDYADGLNRPNLTATLVTRTGNITSNGSDIIDDRPGPLKGSDLTDLSRGSVGLGDPFIGPVSLPAGRYTLRVQSTAGSGDYQVEIRKSDRGTRTATYRGSNSTSLQISTPLVVPDKSIMELSDGVNRIKFQFTYDGTFDFGNIPITISATSTRDDLANAITSAVNLMFTQNRFKVTAAVAPNGIVNFVGDVDFVSGASLFGPNAVIFNTGIGDVNITRDQGQFIVNASTFTKSRDYGVYSGPADLYYEDGRAQQPLYLIGAPTFLSNYAGAPYLGGQYARKLPVANVVPFGVASGSSAERAGLAPGMVIVNNIIEGSGLGGLYVEGQEPTWRITTFPGNNDDASDKSANSTSPPDHSGSFVSDGDLLILDYGRQKVRFEFEDIAGAAVPTAVNGSGVVGGNGWNPNNVPIYYREDAGSQYLRSPNTSPGYAADELAHAIRDSINASVLVTNGTSQHLSTYVEPEGRFFPGIAAADVGGNAHSIIVRGPQFIEHRFQVGWGRRPQITLLSNEYAAAPFLRAVNNTIIGNDGRANFHPEQTDTNTNSTIAGAAETWQGTGTNAPAYTVSGTLTPDPLSTGSSDVDFYKFTLQVGDRVLINVDTTAATPLDSVLKVFNATGQAQIINIGADSTTVDNLAAPGETTTGKDPYVDFTAKVPGVYYAAISAKGNSTYDPLSLADRRRGGTSGAYSLTLKVLKPENFVITAQDPSAYAEGDTFTIDQVADFAGTTNRTKTFEFTRDDNFTAGNIPIFIGPEFRVVDMARSIAGAINAAGLLNTQVLDNGAFAKASPLAPVSAVALGGINGHMPTLDVGLGDNGDLGINSGNARGPEVQAGLNRYRGIVDRGTTDDQAPFDLNVFTTNSVNGRSITSEFRGHLNRGMGHDRTMSLPYIPTAQDQPITARGNGTTEKYIVVRNASAITSRGHILVDKDNGANNNLNQIIPESGVMVGGGASPSLINNVFVNVQTPIVQEATTSDGNVPARPSAVIVGGNTYQYFETRQAAAYLGQPVEAGPTNVPNTALDFNAIAGDTERLFTDAPGGQLLPSSTSRVIDSSIDSLADRSAFLSVKQAVGIAASPILAPDRDHSGQLRADDPRIAPPSGLGGNAFKDRGALDRADFVGPTAIIVNPIDNDAQRVDIDSTPSVLRLTSGVYPEFRIQLKDGFESENLQAGTGVDDSSVVGREGGNRQLGASVTITENGRLLKEGIDYVFSYNTTTNEIILKPLAGIWKNDRVYDITLNNKDRFVVDAQSGDVISDGSAFQILDDNGGTVTFEYDSGFRLQLPRGLEISIPLAGGGAGGIVDGDRFVVNNGTVSTTFEFDSNNNSISGNTRVPFNSLSTQADISAAVIAAISTLANVTPKLVGDGRVFIGAPLGAWVDTTDTASINEPVSTIGLLVPILGTRPGGVGDGQFFVVNDGRISRTFEFDGDGVVTPGRTTIDISAASFATEVATLIKAALDRSGLNLTTQIINGDKVYLGLPNAGSVDTLNSRLRSVGISRTLVDGQSVSITRTVAGVATTKVFEFDSNGTVASGSVPVAIANSDTQSDIGQKLSDAIRDSGLGLTPNHVGDGNISIGGTSEYSISVANASSIGLFGSPGVSGNTTLDILGSLQLVLPRGSSIRDNATFTITNNSRRVVFEFDKNFSGPTTLGNVVIPVTDTSTSADLAILLVPAIQGAGLGINARDVGGGRIDLGLLPNTAVVVGTSGVTTQRGNPIDGDFFTISNGTATVVFEFEDLSIGNGKDPTRTAIRYDNRSTRSDVLASMKAAIESSLLGLSTFVQSDGLKLLDTARFNTNIDNATSLTIKGVAGGAIAIPFIQDPSFTSQQMRDAIIRAINEANIAGRTTLQAKVRGGSTLFVENAINISPEVSSFYLRGIQDLSGNFLKSNRINNETQLTILMPGIQLDFGDAPDPVTTTPGRYPTSLQYDGARHVSNATPLRLGQTVSAELDGLPTPIADGDSSDDGVKFSFQGAARPIFNRFTDNTVTVSLSAPGIVDGWIDFNADGDWSDAGENVLNGVVFTQNTLTQTFLIRVPANTPVPSVSTNSFARFRATTAGNTQPTGLALDGEVEDYLVRIIPGVPPVGTVDRYTMNEDQIGGYVTTDATGRVTPSFTVDDGVLANDSSPDGRPLFARIVTPPAHVVANSFVFNSDGTFSYQPTPNYYGEDTFVYLSYTNVDVAANETLESLTPTTVTFRIRPVNDVPTANSFSRSTDEDVQIVMSTQDVIALSSALAGPANESDQILTLSLPNNVSAQGGSVSIVNGTITYIPQANYSGTDTFTFTLTDNGITGELSDPLVVTRTVTITVRDKNDPPITTPKGFTIDEDTTDIRSVNFYINNDTAGPPQELLPPNGQSITFTSVEPRSEAGGRVSVANGQITYIPPADFNGVDRIFYLITDNGTSGGNPDPQSTRGTVTVTLTPINDAPRVVAPFGTVTMLEDAAELSLPLSSYFTDPDVVLNGDAVSYTIVSNSKPSLIEPTFSAGNIFLKPKPDQNGDAIVVVRATDVAGLSVTNTITISVTPVSDNPRLVAPLPNLPVNEDAVISPITLTPTYFFDPDIINGDALTFTVTTDNQDLVRAAIVNGQLQLTLTPNVSGIANITVRALDSAGNFIEDTFELNVAAVNDSPTVIDDLFYQTPQTVQLRTTDPKGVLTTILNDNGVLANDSDIEGNSFTARVFSQPRFGSVAINLDGTFLYTPGAGAVQGVTDSFQYQAIDSQGGLSLPATVNIKITAPPPARHQNQLLNQDVNADGFVSPIDVLLIINYINFSGQSSISTVGLPDPPPYRDANGDNFISALDVLEVINYINRRGNGGAGEGEGEQSNAGNSSLLWSQNVLRDGTNVGTTMVSTVDAKPIAPPVGIMDSVSDNLAQYLASFHENDEDKLEELATLAAASSLDNRSLDDFFAEAFNG